MNPLNLMLFGKKKTVERHSHFFEEIVNRNIHKTLLVYTYQQFYEMIFFIKESIVIKIY